MKSRTTERAIGILLLSALAALGCSQSVVAAGSPGGGGGGHGGGAVAVAVISQAERTLPVVGADMGDVAGTAATEDTVAIGAATEGEEAMDITEVTAGGAGAALAWGSDSTTHPCRSITRPFGARTDRRITTLMTTIINGKELRTNMKL
jgi:hypothetical protein